ncbi:substrate-binding domain-containing protein [Cyanobium sp. ATX 6F1]|nr:substrate-binding domain-containing protein [Cyanobium sp. ATX 6F1]
MQATLRRRRMISLSFAAVAVVLAAAPLPGLRRPLLVAIGSELAPAMEALEPAFERQHSDIDLEWQVQGSQEMVNRWLDGGPERARVLIPASRDHLTALAEAAQARGEASPFAEVPRTVARTLLVAVVWPQRAQRLFPAGRFSWSRLRQAVAAGQWKALGAPPAWGSFDLRATDPLRSNSGQLTLALWCEGEARPGCVESLRRALYRPARSTDILLKEFISGGPNEGDLAMVYEASALARQPEAARVRPGGYQVLVPDPTIETVLAAAVLRGAGQGRQADGARFVAYLGGAEGQDLLASRGFRRANGRGGSALGERAKRLPPPTPAQRDELLRLWQQAG